MKRTNSYKLETNKQTKEPSRKQNLNRLITSNESESEVAQSFLFLCYSKLGQGWFSSVCLEYSVIIKIHNIFLDDI